MRVITSENESKKEEKINITTMPVNVSSLISSLGRKKTSYDEEGLAFIDKLLDSDDTTYEPPISTERLGSIRDDLVTNYSAEVLEALTNDEVRANLVQIVLKEHGGIFKRDISVAEYIVRECIGTGIIEKIMQDDSITDVGWNGTKLSIETNDDKYLIEGHRLGITSDYIESVISKYATVNDKAFNAGNPTLDGMYKNVRISAVHEDNSPDGATISMRVARPKLALNKNNFQNFAPDHILELFEKMVQTKANICISGETGTGKTELQKLLLSFVDDHERIIMIEDVQETHAKELFPEKDIYSWLTTPKRDISDLVKQALRNNPRWIIISETRGSEAYQMLQAVLSGHHIITTLHAISARATPRRFVNMCASGYKINEVAVEEDVNRYFDFGVHIKKLTIDGKVFRYLSEIVEFNVEGSTTVFEQKFSEGQFIFENGELSDGFRERMAEKFLSYEFPSVTQEVVDSEVHTV